MKCCVIVSMLTCTAFGKGKKYGEQIVVTQTKKIEKAHSHSTAMALSGIVHALRSGVVLSGSAC